MRLLSPVLMASLVIAGSSLFIHPGAAQASVIGAPDGVVDAISVEQGSGKVCHSIILADFDTPVEDLVVTMVNDPLPGVFTVEKPKNYTLCLGTDAPVDTTLVRLKVTDGEHQTFFETHVRVTPRTNAAPTGFIEPIVVPQNSHDGHFCQAAVLEDTDHSTDALTLALVKPLEGLSVEGHSLCVDTTTVLGDHEVELKVSDPAGASSVFPGAVTVTVLLPGSKDPQKDPDKDQGKEQGKDQGATAPTPGPTPARPTSAPQLAQTGMPSSQALFGLSLGTVGVALLEWLRRRHT